MLSYTIREVLTDTYDAEVDGLQDCYIYVIRDGDFIFYVGQSLSPLDRLEQHLGRISPYNCDGVGNLIKENAPVSYDWHIDLYSLAECVEYVRTAVLSPIAWYEENLKNVTKDKGSRKSVINTAEECAIEHFKPCMNLIHNRANKRPLPRKYVKPRIANEGVKLG